MRRQFALFVLGIAVLITLAEIVLRLLPVSTATMTGYHHDADVLTYPSHHEWRMATGWDLRNPQTLRANNWGFAADQDFVPGEDAIALIGDSYVEASMLERHERPAAQLQSLLAGQRKVYALGTPGTALLDYAQRIRFASEHFRLRDFVLLLERADGRQALCGSGNVVSRCLDPTNLQPTIARHAAPGPLARIARHSALAQYLVSQIRFKPDAVVKAMLTRKVPDDSHHPHVAQPSLADAAEQHSSARRAVDAVVKEFFARIPAGAVRHLFIVVDGRRSGPPQTPDLVDRERAHLIGRLREGGAVVHDLESDYARHAAQSGRSLAVGPYDGHLNALGVGLAMAPAARHLNR